MSATQDVEGELVGYINDCRKQSLVVTRVVVTRKLITLKPDAFGGIPSSDSGATERFPLRFGNWYQKFCRKNKFSIRRKMSVGNKKPSGWEEMAWATILKVRGVLTGIVQERIIAKKRGGVRICSG